MEPRSRVPAIFRRKIITVEPDKSRSVLEAQIIDIQLAASHSDRTASPKMEIYVLFLPHQSRI